MHPDLASPLRTETAPMRALVAAPHVSCVRYAGDISTARAVSWTVASTSARVSRIPSRGVSCRVFSGVRGQRTRRAGSSLPVRSFCSLRFPPYRLNAVKNNESAPAPDPASALGESVGGGSGYEKDDNDTTNYEPDAPLPTDALIVACGVGLLTGLGVATFNIAEHGVHDLVFLTTTVYSPDRFQVEGVRDLGNETWTQAVGTIAAPTLAGCLVTGLRYIAGGFDGEDTPRWPFTDSIDASDDLIDREDGQSWWTSLRTKARPALKAAAAVVTLGAGASLGPEGPSVEIGAAIAGSLNEASSGGGSDTRGGTGTTGSAGRSTGSNSGSTTSESKSKQQQVKQQNAARRLGLVAAGSAAGISAGFGAPIAGLFFAFESVLQPAQARRNQTLGDSDEYLGGSTGFGALTTESVILASVLAAVVSNYLLGEQPAFVVPAFELKNLAELPLYLPLGLLCGGTAVAFRASSSVLGKGFEALEAGLGGTGKDETDEATDTNTVSSPTTSFRIPRELHAPLGGLTFGIVATLFPEVTYQGFDNVNSMLGAEGSPFRTPYSPELLFELVLVKLAATALCRQSGLVGGVYAPSLFMGAALGSAYGAALVPLALAGAPVAPPQAYALVGMAGVLAGICRVPLTAILLLFELTHDYRIIVPLMGTVGVASWVAGAAERSSNENNKRNKQKDRKSYVAVEVPAGKAEGVVGGSAVLSFDDDESDDQLFVASSQTNALRAMANASTSARVSDAVRLDVPRVLVTCSALETAKAARSAVRDGSHARCALVVDDTGALRGVATASSLANLLAQGRGTTASALDACDESIPTVASSWTLEEAENLMAQRYATLAAVVATIIDYGEGEGDSEINKTKGAALGVLEAGGAVAERDAAALAAALRAHESFARRKEVCKDVKVTRDK